MDRVYRGRFGILLLVLSISVAFTEPAYSEPIRLTYISKHAKDSEFSQTLANWAKEIEKRTAGKVVIERSADEDKVSVPQIYNAIRADFADIGYVGLQNTRGRFPLMEFISLPIGFPSGAVNTAIINEVYDKFKPAELDEIKVLFLHAPGPGYLHSKGKPILTLQDWQGKKIRSTGTTDQMVELFGATPVSMTKRQIYKNIEDGVIQGGLWEFTSNYTKRLAEVIDNDIICDTTSFSLGMALLMNKKKWGSLDADIQKVFTEVNPVWAAKFGELWDQNDARGLAYSKSLQRNVVIIDPEEAQKWRSKVQPVIDDYVKQTVSRGLPGMDVVKFVEKRIADAKTGKFTSTYIKP